MCHSVASYNELTNCLKLYPRDGACIYHDNGTVSCVIVCVFVLSLFLSPSSHLPPPSSLLPPPDSTTQALPPLSQTSQTETTCPALLITRVSPLHPSPCTHLHGNRTTLGNLTGQLLVHCVFTNTQMIQLYLYISYLPSLSLEFRLFGSIFLSSVFSYFRLSVLHIASIHSHMI